MNEFDLIRRCFAPLAADFAGSLNLTDDAALLDIPAGEQLVITKDAISAGVHFFGDEDAALIARKLLRVNLSDLAAMGAQPLAYALAVMLPKDTTPQWLEQFAHGLAQDQKEFGIHLLGGDTVSTKGPPGFSLTAFGTVPKGQALLRSGARPGDRIYVSGTLGDSALGLLALQRTLPANTFFESRYFLPQPRMALGLALRCIASSAMDISDGLVQDLGHICRASGVGATIHREKLPLSAPARAAVAAQPGYWDAIIAGGDDYELLFTAPQETLQQLASLDMPIACIGTITEGSGVTLLDDAGEKLRVPQGFTHF